MRPFDSQQEAYDAGFADGLLQGEEERYKEKGGYVVEDAYNEGYDHGTSQGEQQRHELEVRIQELEKTIAIEKQKLGQRTIFALPNY